MKIFSILATAGILAAPLSAHAGFIDLPDAVQFDINQNPSTYKVDYSFDFDDGDPFTETRSVITFYTVENESYYDWFDDGGLSVDYGLSHIFLGRGNMARAAEQGADLERSAIFGPVLGETFIFKVSANFYHFCIDESCEGTEGVLESGSATMLVSFYEGDDVNQVPVPASVSLFAIGAAGLLARRFKR
ncbi:MAG: hypothetical protein CME36_12205 [unclassified Hahellaceae]|nr:hypothetical protein [Hahellaceae bacterium]|tara:strand:- start:138385 stop:138951 length:567 start_codon:yes stop_codon:yes gene_type:complete